MSLSHTFERDDMPYALHINPQDEAAWEDHIDTMAEGVWLRIPELENLLDRAPTNDDETRIKSDMLEFLQDGYSRIFLCQAYAIALVAREYISWMGESDFTNDLLRWESVDLMRRIRTKVGNCMDASYIVQALSERIGVDAQIIRNNEEISERTRNQNMNHYLNALSDKGKRLILDLFGKKSIGGVYSPNGYSHRPIW